MTKQYERKLFAGFDVLKLELAIFVIAYYTHAFQGISNPIFIHIISYFMPLVAPAFFTMAGFLLFRKRRKEPLYTEGNKTQVNWYIKRMVKLYLIWNLIYLPMSICEYNGVNILQSFLNYMKNFLFTGQGYLTSPFWYLLATIYGVTFIYFMMKCKIPSWGILLTGIVLYYCSHELTYWMNHIGMLDGWREVGATIAANTIENTNILSCVLYLSMGMIIARSIHLKKVNLWIRTFLCTVACGLYMYIPKENIGMTTLPFVVFAVVWTLSGIRVQRKTAYMRIRNASTIMYFTHMLWYYMYIVLSDIERPTGFIPFIFCVAGGVLISEIQIIWKKNCSKAKNVVIPV